MKDKVRSISEAFSIQPITLTLTDPERRTKFDPSQDIERVELEVMDESTNIYVGYNFDGKILMTKHIDLVYRRIVFKVVIPHEEKLFSIFEQYSKWITIWKQHPSEELGKNF